MPQMDAAPLAILVTELTTDPETIGYASMEALAVAEAMNAPRGTPVKQPVAMADIITWMMENNKLSAILTDTGAAATAFVSLSQISHVTVLDPNNAQVQELFVALKDAALLTVGDLSTIQALAAEVETGPSRAQELGLTFVYPENVEQARG
jgi:hypothetical protein